MAKTNPAVSTPADPELVDDLNAIAPLADVGPDEPAEEGAEPEAEQPIAEDAESEEIGRRSRREGKPEKVDLTKFEEFRQYQAEMDRKLEEANRRAQEREAREAEAQRLAAEQQLQAINRQLDDVVDPQEREKLVRQMTGLMLQSERQQLRVWENYVKGEATKAGLEPQEFLSKPYQTAAEFHADLAKAENAKLRRELEEAKKASAGIPALIRQEVAKALHGQGLDATDYDAGGEPPVSSADARARDIQLFQQGKISGEEFRRRRAGR